MSYKIIATPHFQRELKRLAKKYPSIAADISDLVKSLHQRPIQGDEVFKNCYKIRFTIKSKGRGKSGGGRVVTFVKFVNNELYLLTIFDKSEKENVTDAFIRELLKDLS